VTAPVQNYAVQDVDGNPVGPLYADMELAINQATWLMETGQGPHTVALNTYQLLSSTLVWSPNTGQPGD
jgi:hypothetical protein